MSRVLLIEASDELEAKIRKWFLPEECIFDRVSDPKDVIQLIQTANFDLIVVGDSEFGAASIFYKTHSRAMESAPSLKLPLKNIADNDGLLESVIKYIAEHSEHKTENKPGLDQSHPSDTQYGSKPVLQAGPISLHVEARRVTRDGIDIELTPLEFDFLAFLMQHPNELVTLKQFNRRRDVLQQCASHEAFRTLMKTLRRKLREESKTSLIATVHGLGYRLKA